MYVINNAKEWDALCILYNKSRLNANHVYCMSDTLRIVSLIKNATLVSEDVGVPREFYELYIELTGSIIEARKTVPAIVYLSLGASTVSRGKADELRERCLQQLDTVNRLSPNRKGVNLLTLQDNNTCSDLYNTMQLLYVACILYGLKDAQTPTH